MMIKNRIPLSTIFTANQPINMIYIQYLKTPTHMHKPTHPHRHTHKNYQCEIKYVLEYIQVDWIGKAVLYKQGTGCALSYVCWLDTAEYGTAV